MESTPKLVQDGTQDASLVTATLDQPLVLNLGFKTVPNIALNLVFRRVTMFSVSKHAVQWLALPALTAAWTVWILGPRVRASSSS